MTRQRRSRQCRGSRARNYVRAIARTNAGSTKHNDPAQLLTQARESGALNAHALATKKRIKQLKAQREYLARAAGERLVAQAVETVEAAAPQ